MHNSIDGGNCCPLLMRQPPRVSMISMSAPGCGGIQQQHRTPYGSRHHTDPSQVTHCPDGATEMSDQHRGILISRRFPLAPARGVGVGNCAITTKYYSNAPPPFPYGKMMKSFDYGREYQFLGKIMKHSPALYAKNGKSSASSEPEPVQWWLKTAPAKRRVGRPRKVHPPLNAYPVELPDGIVDLPHMDGIDWSKPAGSHELVCADCGIGQVWVAGRH